MRTTTRWGGVRIARGRAGKVLLLLSGIAGVQLLTLVTGILTARALGAEGRGQLATMGAASTMLAMLALGGYPFAIAQLLARDGLRARDALRPFVRRWSIQASAASLVATVYVAWALRDEAPFLQLGLAGAAAFVTYQTLAGRMIGGSLQGELPSMGKLVVGSLSLPAPFCLLLTVAMAIGWELDPTRVALIQVISYSIGLYLWWRLLKPASGAPAVVEDAELRQVSRANYINSIATINSIGLDRILVGALLGPVQLGLYVVAMAVASLPLLVGNAVRALLTPRLAARHDHPAAQRRLLRTWLAGTALLISGMVVALQLVLAPVIRVAFGEAFTTVTDTARWLLVAYGLLAFRRVLAGVLQARGRGAAASWIELTLTVAFVGGIVVAAHYDRLVLVGVALLVVGVLSCLSQFLVIARPPAAAGPVAGLDQAP